MEPRPLSGASLSVPFRCKKVAGFQSERPPLIAGKTAKTQNSLLKDQIPKEQPPELFDILQKTPEMASLFSEWCSHCGRKGPVKEDRIPRLVRRSAARRRKRERSILDGKEATVQCGFWFADEVPFAAN